MRNSFFDLDQDSTIVSMLTSPENGRQRPVSESLQGWKVLLACVAVSLSIAFLMGGLR